LARHDEISSTERLLDLIRDKSITKSAPPDNSPSPSPIKSPKCSLKNTFSFGKAITVGVDIGYNDLKLVKISQSSDKKHKLLDYRRVPFEPGIFKENPQFPHFLKSALTNFCGASKKIEIWSPVSSSRVDTRHIKIPKVPKNQISNAVYWTYKKETPFDDKKVVFDYEILGDIVENGVQKKEVMACTAPKEEIEELKKIFSKSGFPLTGITFFPFASQNLLKTQCLEPIENTICFLYIGMDWSRIDIFSHENLRFSRGIKAGINSMIKAIRNEIDKNQAKHSVKSGNRKDSVITETLGKNWDTETNQAKNILFTLINNSPSFAEKGEEFYFKKEEIFKIIFPVLQRLVRRVETTLKHYSLNFGNENIGKVYVSGELSTYKPLVSYIENQLDIPVETIDPFTSGTHFSSEVSNPESASIRASFAPTIGVALSNNSFTPNLIFTYKDKQKLGNIRFFNRTIFSTSLFFMAICIGIYFWKGHLVNQKKAQASQLQQQLEIYNPYVDEKLMLEQITQIERKKQALEECGKKYLDIAVISEICNLTPHNIQLLSFTANLPRIPQKKGESQKMVLVLDGIVVGDRQTLETSLASYLVSLKNSPIFGRPRIRNRSFEFFKNKDALRFIADLELVKDS
jgi:type IV pilus assembly protein PilM